MTGRERIINYLPGGKAFEFGPYKCISLSRFDMLEPDNGINVIISFSVFLFLSADLIS